MFGGTRWLLDKYHALGSWDDVVREPTTVVVTGTLTDVARETCISHRNAVEIAHKILADLGAVW